MLQVFTSLEWTRDQQQSVEDSRYCFNLSLTCCLTHTVSLLAFSEMHTIALFHIQPSFSEASQHTTPHSFDAKYMYGISKYESGKQRNMSIIVSTESRMTSPDVLLCLTESPEETSEYPHLETRTEAVAGEFWHLLNNQSAKSFISIKMFLLMLSVLFYKGLRVETVLSPAVLTGTSEHRVRYRAAGGDLMQDIKSAEKP